MSTQNSPPAGWTLTREGLTVHLKATLSPGMFLALDARWRKDRVLGLTLDAPQPPGTLIHMEIALADGRVVQVGGRVIFQMGAETLIEPELQRPDVLEKWVAARISMESVTGAPTPREAPSPIQAPPSTGLGQRVAPDTRPPAARATTRILTDAPRLEPAAPAPPQTGGRFVETLDKALADIDLELSDGLLSLDEPLSFTGLDPEVDLFSVDLEAPRVAEVAQAMRGRFASTPTQPLEKPTPDDQTTTTPDDQTTPDTPEPTTNEESPEPAQEPPPPAQALQPPPVDAPEVHPTTRSLATAAGPFTRTTLDQVQRQMAMPNTRTPRPEGEPRLTLPSDEERAEVLRQLPQGQPRFRVRFEGQPVINALARAACVRGHGLLTVELDEVTVAVLLRGGSPIDAQAWPQTGRWALGTLLAQSGQVTPDALAHARAQAEGMDIGEALMSSGALDGHKLKTLRRVRLLFMLRLLRDARHGTASFHTLDVLPYDVELDAVGFGGMVAEAVNGWASAIESDQIREVLEARRNLFPVRVHPPPFSVSLLGLDHRELRFYDSVIDDTRRLWELMTISNLGRSATVRLLLRLEAAGLLRFKASVEVDRFVQALIDEVEARARVIEELNPFEALNIHWSAYAQAVDAGLRTEQRKYDPERFPQAIRPEIEPHLRRIHAALQAAQERLRTPTGRTQARAHIMGEQQLRTSLALFEKQAEMALWRHELPQARDYCLRLLELRPGHPAARDMLRQMGEGQE